MKRVKLVLLCTVMFIFIISLKNIVKANDQLGTVTALSSGANPFDGNTENVVIEFDELNLTWYKADPAIGRNVDGYWVGYKVEAPSSVNSQEAAQKVGYHRKMIGQTDWTSRPFTEVLDGEWYMTGWAQVTQERLNGQEASFVLYEAEFDWDGDSDYDQKVTIKINPKNTTLEANNKSTVRIKELGKGASGTETAFDIYKGTTLSAGLTETEKETLKDIQDKDGFEGFYKLPSVNTDFDPEKLSTYEKFDPDKDVINESEVLVVAYFNVIPEPEPEPEPEKEKDDTPKTGNIDILSYVISAIAVSSVGIILLNKKNNH